MTKRLIALLLSVMMVVTLLPAGIFAAGETAPAEGEGTSSAKNELIYSTEGIDHTWYTLSNNNDGIKIIDSVKYSNGATNTFKFQNNDPIDMSDDGIVKNMPANTWAYGYVVEFSGFTGDMKVSLPFGATVQKVDGTDQKTLGQGINVKLWANDTLFTIKNPGVYLLMTSAMNILGSTAEHRIIAQAHELHLAKKQVPGTVKVRVLGSVAATVGDINTIAGDAGLKYSSYYSDMFVSVDGETYQATNNLTDGVLKKDGEDGIKYLDTTQGRVDYRATPAFPALTIPKPEVPEETGYVNKLVGFTTVQGSGKAEISCTENTADNTITLDIAPDNFVSKLYPVWRKTAADAPEISDTNDGWFGEADAVKIPNTDTDTIPATGTKVWDKGVEFADDTAHGITFVFEAKGVDDPIALTKVNPYFTDMNNKLYNWSNSVGNWLFRAELGNGTNHVFCPEMKIDKDGIYYLYLNVTALVDDKAYKNGADYAVKSVQSFNIFDNQHTKPEWAAARANTNDNATFRMLAVVANDLKTTVNFFDTNGALLLNAEHAYSSVGDVAINKTDKTKNNEIKQAGAAITPQELFDNNGGIKPNQPDPNKEYDLVWVNELGEPVEQIYQSQNLYAKFIEVPSVPVVENTAVKYNSLGFTVGNTLALKVNVSCEDNDILYTECDKWTAYLEAETEPGVWTPISKQTKNSNTNVTFKLSGIPAAYMVNNLKVRFEGKSKYGNTIYVGDELTQMDVGTPISFVTYSQKAKAQEPDNAELANLLNSMLNYAASVQTYKSYKPNELANAGINVEVKSIEDYTDEEWANYNTARGVTAPTGSEVTITSSQLLLKTDKVGFRFYFTADDASGLTVKVTDESGATEEISEITKVSDGKYYATFDGFGPTSFNTPVKVSVYRGGVQVSNIAQDSIPAMAKNVATNAKHVSMRPVLSTLLAYSNAAIAYVAKQ